MSVSNLFHSFFYTEKKKENVLVILCQYIFQQRFL